MKHSLPIRILFKLFSFLLLIFLCSCSNKPQANLAVFRALASSLNSSNALITSENISLIKSMEQKLAEPSTAETATYWYPKAILAQKISKDMIEYIDHLKDQLKQEAGLVKINEQLSFRENDITAVSRLFNKKGKGQELKQQLEDFEIALLAIDQEMNNTFKSTINLTIRLSDPSEDIHKTFTDTFFRDIPTVAAIAILNKFENNIKIMENQLLVFCNNKIPDRQN